MHVDIWRATFRPPRSSRNIMQRSTTESSRYFEYGETDFEVSSDIEQTISDPLKEGHHFDQSLGGVAGFFENMRSNTQV